MPQTLAVTKRKLYGALLDAEMQLKGPEECHFRPRRDFFVIFFLLERVGGRTTCQALREFKIYM